MLSVHKGGEYRYLFTYPTARIHTDHLQYLGMYFVEVSTFYAGCCHLQVIKPVVQYLAWRLYSVATEYKGQKGAKSIRHIVYTTNRYGPGVMITWLLEWR